MVIAESDLNDVRVINPPNKGGYGLDAQWNDDFHHCLHTLLTKERNGYYQDFGDVQPDWSRRFGKDSFTPVNILPFGRDDTEVRRNTSLPLNLSSSPRIMTRSETE